MKGELITVLKTSLLLRQQSHRLILIAAPVDHLLTSLSMAMRKEITHNVYLPFYNIFLFFSSLFLLCGFGVIVCPLLPSTDPSFFKQTTTEVSIFQDACPVVCDLVIPKSQYSSREHWCHSVSPGLSTLGKFQARGYKYYPCCIFDSLYSLRTSSFSGCERQA